MKTYIVVIESPKGMQVVAVMGYNVWNAIDTLELPKGYRAVFCKAQNELGNTWV